MRSNLSSFDAEIEAALNDQVTRERYAQALYTQIASEADCQGFSGLSHWADEQAQEEWTHAKKLTDYLRLRCCPRLADLPAPEFEWTDYLGALAAALGAERMVTEALREIYHLAVSLGDGATIELLLWFLREQAESENFLDVCLQKVGRGAPADLLDAILFEE